MTTRTYPRTSVIVADNGFMDLTPRGKRAAINAARRYAFDVPGITVRAVDASTGEALAAYVVDNGKVAR